MEVIGRTCKNIAINGQVYSVSTGNKMSVPDSIAYIMSANGYASIVQPEVTRGESIWREPISARKKLKKYTGDKIVCCINTEDRAKIESLVTKYGEKFDGFSIAEGKYRFYGGDWANQIQKRNSYFQEAINFILDTDEDLHGTPSLPKGYDVGWVKVTNKGRSERWQPRVFRYIEGMHYLKRHHWIFDGNGDLIASHSKEGKNYKHIKLDNVSLNNEQDSKYTGKQLERRNDYRKHIFQTEMLQPEVSKASLNILHVNLEDMAGLSARLSNAINKYTRHSSRSYKAFENYLDFETDMIIDETLPYSALTADVVVFNETYSIEPPYKPIIMIHHGTHYRNHLQGAINADNVADVIFVTTMDLLKHDERSIWLPSIIDVDKYASYKTQPDGFKVVHSSTSRAKRGTDEILRVVPDMEIIERMSHEESLKARGNASVFIDHLMPMGIGVGALEAMAMKIPVICGSDDEAIAKYKEIVGYLPYIPVKTAEEIPAILEKLKNDKKFYNKYAELGYKYVKEYHDTEVCAKRFEKICWKVLKREKVTQEDVCI